jgi:hypothetical protein
MTLNLTESQLDALYAEWQSNPEARNRRKCLVVYLRAIGSSRQEVSRITRVNEDQQFPLITRIIKEHSTTR